MNELMLIRSHAADKQTASTWMEGGGRKYEAIRVSIIFEFIFSTPQIKIADYRSSDIAGHYKSSGHEIWKSEGK